MRTFVSRDGKTKFYYEPDLSGQVQIRATEFNEFEGVYSVPGRALEEFLVYNIRRQLAENPIYREDELQFEGEQDFLAVVKFARGGLARDVRANYLVKARSREEAQGRVRQEVESCSNRGIIEYLVAEEENPLLVRAVRFDQQAHLLPTEILQMIEPLQLGSSRETALVKEEPVE